MSTTMWGPALDAELAYRRERLRDDLRPRRTARSAGPRAARTAPAARGTRTRAPGRRWVLPGSGAWHAAR